MADTVLTQIIQDGDQVALIKFTNQSDGTGEAAVTKIFAADLEAHSSTKKPCVSVAINRIWYNVYGMNVDILWDATTDTLAWSLAGDGYIDFRCGPITNPMGSGVTGNVNFTTVGHDSGDRYSILMEVRKSYTDIPPSED